MGMEMRRMTKPKRRPISPTITNPTGCPRSAATAQLGPTVHASSLHLEPRDVCRQEMLSQRRRPVATLGITYIFDPQAVSPPLPRRKKMRSYFAKPIPFCALFEANPLPIRFRRRIVQNCHDTAGTLSQIPNTSIDTSRGGFNFALRTPQLVPHLTDSHAFNMY